MARQDLIDWKTDAWKDPGMAAWYARRMLDSSGTNPLKNRLETDLCAALALEGRLLDVGVGTGRASLPLAERGWRVTGVDSSQAMLDECRRLAGDLPIELRQADLARLSFADGEFDTVMALNVLTHFPHWREVVAEWARVARPGGRIVFDVYSRDHLDAAGRQPPAEDDAKGFNLYLRAADLITEAERQGLSLAVLIPYGLILENTTAWLEDLEKTHAWRRHLSWLAHDSRFFDFALFIEQQCAARGSPRWSGRYMVALEKTPDPERGRAWLHRFQLIDGITAEGLGAEEAAAMLPVPLADWQAELAGHLDYPRNRVALYLLLKEARRRGLRLDEAGLLDPETLALFRLWREQEDIDARSLAMLRSWHAHPGIASELRHAGVDLGSGMEYPLMRAVLEDYFHLFPEHPANNPD